jgi:hypothetical protein
MADAAPVTLKLDDLISKGRSNVAKDDEPDTCPRRKRTNDGRKGKGEGLELEWPSDDSLTAGSKFHVTQGHWAFETVNGSCWNTAAEYMTQTAADFVAVQEAKTLKESIADTEQAARNKGWRTSISPCILTEAESSSAGTALCCRTHIVARRSFADECSDDVVQARFQMKHLGAVCKGGIHFGSCYLHCNWDHNRTFNLDLLQCISAMIATLRGP